MVRIWDWNVDDDGRRSATLAGRPGRRGAVVPIATGDHDAAMRLMTQHLHDFQADFLALSDRVGEPSA